MAHGDIVKDADLGKDAAPPGLGETETLPRGAITVGDAVPEMPPGNDMNDVRGSAAAPGGGLTADDTAQPTSTADTTGDRATGLTALRD